MAAILGEELMRQAMADLSWSRKVLVDMVANGNDCGSLLRYLTLYKNIQWTDDWDEFASLPLTQCSFHTMHLCSVVISIYSLS